MPFLVFSLWSQSPLLEKNLCEKKEVDHANLCQPVTHVSGIAVEKYDCRSNASDRLGLPDEIHMN